VSSRRPSDWDEDDWGDEPPRPRRRGTPPPRARTFGIPVVAAALVGGLFVGYVVSSGGGGTTTITQTRTVTAPAVEAAAGVEPSAESTRSTISLAVLNGSGESGLAASTAEDARQIGYERVTEGNAPTPVTTDLVLHRPGAAPRAARVAEDLGLPAPELATADDPALAQASDADVVVLLGPTGAATTDDGTLDDGTVEDGVPDTTDVPATSTSPTG
jgi:hypothetical protein